jgi:hypothetical protein
MKVHVVLERGYEYNDSTYDATDGGNAIHGYLKIEDAQREADRLSLILAREGNFHKLHSEYSLFNSLYEKDLHKLFTKYGIDYYDIESWYEFDRLTEVIPKMTDEEILIIVNNLTNKPYYIQSCDFNE